MLLGVLNLYSINYPATMKHGANESVKEQSQMEMTIKTEVEAAATSTAHIDSIIHLNYLKREAVQSVKSELALLIKEEVLEDGSQDGNEQQCIQGGSTPASTGSVNEACSTSLGDLINVKHELDIGPTVLQHMDIHYTINKNMSAVREENTMVDDSNKAMSCKEVKKESIEDKLRVVKIWRDELGVHSVWTKMRVNFFSFYSFTL